jgi:hypothetical protein
MDRGIVAVVVVIVVAGGVDLRVIGVVGMAEVEEAR